MVVSGAGGSHRGGSNTVVVGGGAGGGGSHCIGSSNVMNSLLFTHKPQGVYLIYHLLLL